jgi:hypothetical protein
LQSNTQENLELSSPKNNLISNNQQNSSNKNAESVDVLSSFLFPISFIIFQIVYWIVYLNSKYPYYVTKLKLRILNFLSNYFSEREFGIARYSIKSIKTQIRCDKKN